MKAGDQDAFREYVVARNAALLRTAYLLSGDWHRAEDVVSTALVKLYTAWPKIREVEHLDAYVRRIVVRVWLDERRRPWRREAPADPLPDPDAGRDGFGVPADAADPDRSVAGLTARRADLHRLLARMPARQRAVLVLRFYDDLSVEQTAGILGCSEGAVKTLTNRALDSIRRLLPAGVTTRTQYEEAP
ncbi:RNA polymerase sigma-70 factor (sigma-E family) [Kribbella amoyensis]|uniref:RNA polymerase sigma-70 factor (Sigma-E family) n=1 Tax=Kribbella amoyensis TaxID=996641 RepID=A0A561BLC3_9ACTN|nr:SigE family RNA polymerase sigma factor [Kribbella amoyensis]TWD79691.1 RNA polymerase sigma-70 factor (sigma-E family) [Kribbella amoyensis]